jgi:hypothetical protein
LLLKEVSLTQFADNKIHTNTSYPLQMHLADASKLEDLNEFGTNGKEFIQLMGSGSEVILQKITLKKLRIPFVISGQSVAGAMVEILAGARVYMDDQAELTHRWTKRTRSIFCHRNCCSTHHDCCTLQRCGCLEFYPIAQF